MQAIEHDGTRRMVERYNERKIEAHLDDPNVKEVRVFRLKRGMTITVHHKDGGQVEEATYKVIAARPNGKVTLRPV